MSKFIRLNSFLVLILFSIPDSTYSQVTIRGKIFDQANNKPIEDARISVPAMEIDKIKTGEEGMFKLSVAKIPDRIRITADGYQSKFVTLPNDTQLLKGLRIGLRVKGWQNLSEVVVTGYQGSKDASEVPGNISVLSEETIQSQSNVTLVPALDLVPGLHYQQGAYSTGRMTIRGIGARSPYSTTKIKAYLNQIPLTTGEGITNLMDIEPSIISRAEIIKGPVSSIYGAGLGGAVLLEPVKGKEKGTEIGAGVEVGSFGYQKIKGTIADVTDDHRLFLNYANTKADGFRENSQYNRHSATATGTFYTDENNVFSFFGSFTHLKSYIPSSLDYETFQRDRTEAADNWASTNGFEEYDKVILGASYKIQVAENLESTTALFMNYKNNYEPRPFNILKDTRFSYGARHLTSFTPEILNMETTWTLGGEVFNENYQWSIFENINSTIGHTINENEQNRFYYNIFARGKVDIAEKLTISAGLNYNQTQYQLEDLYIADSVSLGTPEYEQNNESGSYDFDPIWSPRVGINYQWSKRNNVYASVSHGFSQPNVQETLTPQGALNPDIKPETGWSYEVGGRGAIPALGLGYNLSLYHMLIKNKLVARRVGPDAYIGLNAGATVHNGVEVSLEGQNLLNRSGLRKLTELRPFVNYSYQDFRFKEFKERGNDYSGNRLTGTAPHHLSAGIVTTLWENPQPKAFTQKVGLRLTYRFRDRMPVLDDNSIYTSSYQLFNARLDYSISLGSNRLEIFFEARNIFDEWYASMIVPNALGYGGDPRYYYPGTPRNFRGGVSLYLHQD